MIKKVLYKIKKWIFFARMNAGYAALRKDKAAWAEELEERKLWDNTIGDGLEQL